MKKGIEKHITNIEILRYHKVLLKEEIDAQEEILEHQMSSFWNHLSPKLVLDELFGVGSKSTLIHDLVPLVLKYREQFNLVGLFSQLKHIRLNNPLIVTVFGFASGFVSYMLYSWRSKK